MREFFRGADSGHRPAIIDVNAQHESPGTHHRASKVEKFLQQTYIFLHARTTWCWPETAPVHHDGDGGGAGGGDVRDQHPRLFINQSRQLSNFLHVQLFSERGQTVAATVFGGCCGLFAIRPRNDTGRKICGTFVLWLALVLFLPG